MVGPRGGGCQAWLGSAWSPPQGGLCGGSLSHWFLILQSQPLYVVIKNWTWSWIGGVALFVAPRGGGCQAWLGSAWSPPQGGAVGGSLNQWFLILQPQPLYVVIKNWIGVGLGGCPLGGTKGWGLPGMAGFSMEPPSGGAVGGSLSQWFLILQPQLGQSLNPSTQ